MLLNYFTSGCFSHHTSLPFLLSVFTVLLLLLFRVALKKYDFWKTTHTDSSTTSEPDANSDQLGFKCITPFEGLPLSQKPEWPRYWKPGKFQMTMALRKMDINNWLRVDELYDSEHAAKVAMIKSPDSENYVDYLDGIDDAAVELMETVVTYLVKRYPAMFRSDGEYVYIDHLNEKYRIKQPYDYHPLAVAGVLVHEDLYILKLGPKQQYTM